MKKLTFNALLLVLLINSQEAYAQINLFEDEVLSFLSEKENLGEQVDIKVVAIPHLFTFQLFDGETIGIYKFVMTGSHQISYLFFFDGKEMSIVKEYELVKDTKRCHLFHQSI